MFTSGITGDKHIVGEIGKENIYGSAYFFPKFFLKFYFMDRTGKCV